MALVPIVSTLGLLLWAFSYSSGVVNVGSVDPGRAVWIVVCVCVAALALGWQADFSPEQFRLIFPSAEDITGDLRGAVDNMRRMFGSFGR